MITFADMGTALAERLGELDRVIADAKDRVTLAATQNAALAEPFLGKKDAALLLGWSVSTLERRMEHADGPPRYTDAGKVQFLASELKVWRKQWRVGQL